MTADIRCLMPPKSDYVFRGSVRQLTEMDGDYKVRYWPGRTFFKRLGKT